MKRFTTLVALALLSTLSVGATARNATATLNPTCADYFMRPGCIYCARVSPFLANMTGNSTMNLELRVHNVDRLYESRVFDAASKKMKWDGGNYVPTLIIGKSVLRGDSNILKYAKGVIISEEGAQCLDVDKLLSERRTRFSTLSLVIGGALALIQALSPMWMSTFRILVTFIGTRHGAEGTEIKLEKTSKKQKRKKYSTLDEEEDGELIAGTENVNNDDEEIVLNDNDDDNENNVNIDNDEEDDGNIDDEDEIKDKNEVKEELIANKDASLEVTLDSGGYVCISLYILVTLVLNTLLDSFAWIVASAAMDDPNSKTIEHLVYAISGVVILIGLAYIVLSAAKIQEKRAIARAAKRVECSTLYMLAKISSCAGRGLACLVCALVAFFENSLWAFPAFFLFAISNAFRFGDSASFVVFISAVYNLVGTLLLLVLLFVAALSWKKFESVIKIFSGKKGIYFCSFLGVLYLFVGAWLIVNDALFFFF